MLSSDTVYQSLQSSGDLCTIYESKCARLGHNANVRIAQQLVLMDSTRCRTLNLKGIPRDDTFVCVLEVLVLATGISVVDFSNCDLSDRDINMLAHHVLRTTGVRKIILDENPKLTDRGGRDLLSVLEHYVSIVHISLRRTSISPSLKERIEAAVERNAAIAEEGVSGASSEVSSSHSRMDPHALPAAARPQRGHHEHRLGSSRVNGDGDASRNGSSRLSSASGLTAENLRKTNRDFSNGTLSPGQHRASPAGAANPRRSPSPVAMVPKQQSASPSWGIRRRGATNNNNPQQVGPAIGNIGERRGRRAKALTQHNDETVAMNNYNFSSSSTPISRPLSTLPDKAYFDCPSLFGDPLDGGPATVDRGRRRPQQGGRSVGTSPVEDRLSPSLLVSARSEDTNGGSRRTETPPLGVTTTTDFSTYTATTNGALALTTTGRGNSSVISTNSLTEPRKEKICRILDRSACLMVFVLYSLEKVLELFAWETELFTFYVFALGLSVCWLEASFHSACFVACLALAPAHFFFQGYRSNTSAHQRHGNATAYEGITHPFLASCVYRWVGLMEVISPVQRWLFTVRSNRRQLQSSGLGEGDSEVALQVMDRCTLYFSFFMTKMQQWYRRNIFTKFCLVLFVATLLIRLQTIALVGYLFCFLYYPLIFPIGVSLWKHQDKLRGVGKRLLGVVGRDSSNNSQQQQLLQGNFSSASAAALTTEGSSGHRTSSQVAPTSSSGDMNRRQNQRHRTENFLSSRLPFAFTVTVENLEGISFSSYSSTKPFFPFIQLKYEHQSWCTHKAPPPWRWDETSKPLRSLGGGCIGPSKLSFFLFDGNGDTVGSLCDGFLVLDETLPLDTIVEVPLQPSIHEPSLIADLIDDLTQFETAERMRYGTATASSAIQPSSDEYSTRRNNAAARKIFFENCGFLRVRVSSLGSHSDRDYHGPHNLQQPSILVDPPSPPHNNMRFSSPSSASPRNQQQPQVPHSRPPPTHQREGSEGKRKKGSSATGTARSGGETVVGETDTGARGVSSSPYVVPPLRGLENGRLQSAERQQQQQQHSNGIVESISKGDDLSSRETSAANTSSTVLVNNTQRSVSSRGGEGEPVIFRSGGRGKVY